MPRVKIPMRPNKQKRPVHRWQGKKPLSPFRRFLKHVRIPRYLNVILFLIVISFMFGSAFAGNLNVVGNNNNRLDSCIQATDMSGEYQTGVCLSTANPLSMVSELCFSGKCDRVVKAIYTGQISDEHVFREAKRAELAAKIGIGPEIFDYGICSQEMDSGRDERFGFIVSERMDLTARDFIRPSSDDETTEYKARKFEQFVFKLRELFQRMEDAELYNILLDGSHIMVSRHADSPDFDIYLDDWSLMARDKTEFLMETDRVLRKYQKIADITMAAYMQEKTRNEKQDSWFTIW
jgi:hypothetical protein